MDYLSLLEGLANLYLATTWIQERRREYPILTPDQIEYQRRKEFPWEQEVLDLYVCER